MTDPVPILLVDDEVRNLEALEAVLEASGCELVRATSADEALLALLDRDFAAIVLDIKMPGMDGIQLAELVKARRRSRHVPILFLTAHMLDEQSVLRGYGVGAVDYLTKPLNPEILRSKIAVFVDLYRKTIALTRAIDALQSEVAERERVQEELRQAKSQLEMRVQARTAEVMHAHDVLRASEERLRVALDAGRMGTWELDDATGILTLDEVQCALLGLAPGTSAATTDRAFMNVTHPEDRERLESTLKHARNASTSGEFEAEFRVTKSRPYNAEDPTAEVRWLIVRGRVMREPGGTARHVVGVGFDITEQKRIEETLTDADRRKNAFLATLAHELRNPLAPIRNAIQILLLRGPSDPDLNTARQVIARQTQQLARLVDDLLDISRITRDTLELRREGIELEAVINAAVETSRPLIDAGGHQLTIALPSEPLMINADLTRLAQVISNLLNNSAKYSDRGAHISLSAAREGAEAVIRVKDDGIGIDAAMLPYIFEMFVQVERTRERNGGGLGVGLALAKRLVEMHDGKIEVMSEGAGHGSEFIVRLPMRVVTSSMESPQTVDDEDLTASLRVLVVDDNRDAAESLGMLLQMMGHDVREAHDGLEAVDVAGSFSPHVVLLDIGLPKLNGYDAARRIRALGSENKPVLIALTGWGQESDRHQSYAAGFDYHLVKPVDPSDLMRLLVSVGPDAAPLAAVAPFARLTGVGENRTVA